jgi:hypothetical protein
MMPDPTPTPTLAQLEPIRLPAWVVTLIVVFGVPVATALLTSQDWKPVLAGCLATAVPYLAVSEVARAKSVPKVTHESDIVTTQALGYAAAIDAKQAGIKQGKEHVLNELEAVATEKKATALQKRRATIAAKARPAKARRA